MVFLSQAILAVDFLCKYNLTAHIGLYAIDDVYETLYGATYWSAEAVGTTVSARGSHLGLTTLFPLLTDH